MGPRRSIGSLAMVLMLTACSGGTVATSGQPAGGGQESSVSAKGTALTTSVRYEGTYQEELKYTTTSPLDPSDVRTIDKNISFAFKESVSLVTPKTALLRKPFTTAAVTSSIPRPVFFNDTGTISYTETPDPSHNKACNASLNGRSGTDWTTTTAQPPVQIAIAAVNPDDSLAKDYRLQVTAVLPTSGAQQNITSSATDPTGECADQRYLSAPDTSPALFQSSQYTGVLWAGPNAPPFLVLPLDTQDYTRHYSVHQTFPYSFSGGSGTDEVNTDTTLTVNDTGHLYAALGDSFSSGAMPDIIPPAGCQRSTKAYPELYDEKGLVFLACSAQSTQQITADQVPGIPPNAEIVSLTSGGDDFYAVGGGAQGLFGVLENCVLFQYGQELLSPPLGIRLYPCQAITTVISNIESQFPTIQSNLEALIAAIHKQAENARIYVLGYPNPLPATFQRGSCPGLENILLPGAASGAPLQGLAPDDVGYMSRVVDGLNTAVRQAATSSGVATYVDPFTGHDVCSTDSWFFPLGLGGTIQGQPLHPTPTGQQAMEQSLLGKAGPPPS